MSLLDDLGRVVCPDDNHYRDGLRIVCSPRFFETGGTGMSTYACDACIEDVAAFMTRRYGGCEIHEVGS